MDYSSLKTRHGAATVIVIPRVECVVGAHILIHYIYIIQACFVVHTSWIQPMETTGSHR
jgi:hypothetical protein